MRETRKYLTANQFPHKKNYARRSLRWFLSFLPLILPPKDHPKRPMGISVYMRVKNERDWIIPSIQSISTIADEICLVDNGSTDGTLEMVKELAQQEPDFIRIWEEPNLSHVELSNIALGKTRFHYVFRWDGDMIAHTSGENDIRKLRTRLLKLNPRRYFVIYLRHVNLSGDLFHQDRREMVHIEEYIHTFSPLARFIHTGRFEAVKFPLYYRPLFWYEPFAFHVNVKPRQRLLRRFFWEEWMEKKDYLQYPTLDKYVEARIRDTFGTDNTKEAAYLCLRESLSHHIPYDEKIFGPYPELLQPFLSDPSYLIDYRNGQPYDRREPDED